MAGGVCASPSSMQDVVCRHYGALDDSKFGAPMPWVGMYVALASFVCALLIVADIVDGLRMKKHWIPSKWFTFNSATLTILGVATKLPSDISTAMPGLGDQLAKLGGLVLLCVAMGHAGRSMVAIDGVSGSTIFSNMTALGIIVVTLFVDVWIQIHTGVVVDYVGWYKVYSMLMLVLYGVAVWYSVSGTRTIFAYQIYQSCAGIRAKFLNNKYSSLNIGECICSHWWVGLACSPGSPTYQIASGSVSAAISAGMGIVFMVLAAIQTFYASSWQCFVRSDYKWSNLFILVFQYIGILAGTVSCLLYSIPSLLSPQPFELTDVLGCYIYFGNPRELINYPLPLTLRRKSMAKIAHAIKKPLFIIFIIVNSVATCPFKIIIALLYLLKFAIAFLCYGRNPSTSATNTGAASASYPMDIININQLLSPDDPVYASLQKCFESLTKTVHYLYHKQLKHGRQYKPATLLRFLQQNSPPWRQGFPLVKQAIHKHRTLGDDGEQEERCCWSLTIATLAIIVRATMPEDQLPHFMEAVEAAIGYALCVDENFPFEHHRSTALMLAAKVVWDVLNLQDRWLGLDLRKETTTARNHIEVIQLLAKRARVVVEDILLMDRMPDWSLSSTAAAECMMLITSKLLVTVPREQQPSIGDGVDDTSKRILWDVVGACLLSLPEAIMNKCNKGKLHAWDNKASDAAFILGQAEDIIAWLQARNHLQYCPSTGIEYINGWAIQNV